jgi:hypothetical protein
VEQFDWIRRNQEKKEGEFKYHDEMDAEELGVGLEEEAPRKKYDLDKEEEEVVRHEVRKKVMKIRSTSVKAEKQVEQQQKWRKNKFMLSPEEIRKML